MLLLWGPVLYREEAGWHRNAILKNGVSPRGPKLWTPIASCGVKKKPTVHRVGDQQPQYQAERAGCAGYGLVAKSSSKITNSS